MPAIRRRKEAAHGFRDLSEIRITGDFEYAVKALRTKSDIFVNEKK